MDKSTKGLAKGLLASQVKITNIKIKTQKKNFDKGLKDKDLILLKWNIGIKAITKTENMSDTTPKDLDGIALSIA